VCAESLARYDGIGGCFDTDKYKPELQKEIAVAGSLSISSTLTFVLGKLSSDNRDGQLIVGAMPHSVLETEIRKSLGTNCVLAAGDRKFGIRLHELPIERPESVHVQPVASGLAVAEQAIESIAADAENFGRLKLVSLDPSQNPTSMNAL